MSYNIPDADAVAKSDHDRELDRLGRLAESQLRSKSHATLTSHNRRALADLMKQLRTRGWDPGQDILPDEDGYRISVHKQSRRW